MYMAGDVLPEVFLGYGYVSCHIHAAFGNAPCLVGSLVLFVTRSLQKMDE